MSHQYSFRLAILAIIAGASALTGCVTTPGPDEVGADIEVTIREGMGGTGVSPHPPAGRAEKSGNGVDPDGIGGTGIIGAIGKNGVINVAGINVPSLENTEIFLNGKVADSGALIGGRIAAVWIDNERAVREIHVFDQFVGSVPFLQSVSRLIVRGEVVKSTMPDKVTVNGIAIPVPALGGKTTGDIVRIDASAVPAGGFKINTVEKVSPAMDRPQSIESIIKPSSVENKPAEKVRPDIVTDRPARPEPNGPPTRPERIERPDIPARPNVPAPVERPALPDRTVRPAVPDKPDRPVLDRPEPPVVVEPPKPVEPPDITPVLPSVDRPDLPRRLD